MSDSNNKVLVRNTANHPAMRIPPGGTGEVDEAVLAHAKYLVRVEPESTADDRPPPRRGR